MKKEERVIVKHGKKNPKTVGDHIVNLYKNEVSVSKNLLATKNDTISLLKHQTIALKHISNLYNKQTFSLKSISKIYKELISFYRFKNETILNEKIIWMMFRVVFATIILLSFRNDLIELVKNILSGIYSYLSSGFILFKNLTPSERFQYFYYAPSTFFLYLIFDMVRNKIRSKKKK